MNRRRMLASMAGASLLVGTQGLANDRIRRIGMLNLTTPGNSRVAEDFSTVLRELGWIEGKNLALDLRTAPGDAALQRQYAAELVRMNVDVIMTLGYDATMAARDATKRIPIVMNISVDPVKAGLVTSLGRPGGSSLRSTCCRSTSARRRSSASRSYSRCCCVPTRSSADIASRSNDGRIT